MLILAIILICLVALAIAAWMADRQSKNPETASQNRIVMIAGAVLLVGYLVLYQPGFAFLLGIWGFSNWKNFKQISPIATVQDEAKLQVDACFSWPAFREFVCLLYAQALQDGGTGMSARHLENGVRTQLGKRFRDVSQVTVGSVTPKGVNREGPDQILAVNIEANYWMGGKSYASREVWVLARPLGQVSPEPKTLIRIGCPNCGFSGEAPGGVCPACSGQIPTQSSQWKLRRANVVDQQEFRWQAPSPSSQERPIRRHPQLRARQEAFLARYPQFDLAAFRREVEQAFMDLQRAWSAGQLAALRPWETDSLYQTHRFWLDFYQRMGRRNRLDKVQLHSAEIANIVHDNFYDAITVQVVASMVDLMVDGKGVILSGDANRPVRFGEYWTFIRRAGYQKGAGSDRTRCPSCGGDLANVRQTGECEHCGNLLTLGDFGWVLSCIEQEEVYQPVGG